MFENLYFNLFSLGALIPSIFVSLVALFLFAVRQKSSATIWLGFTFLFMALFYAPYFPASTVFDSSMAFHRWLTVPFVLLAGLSFGQFALHFPERSHPRFATTLLIVQLAITIVMSAAFYYTTIDAPRIYHFDGHYWDFAADQISKLTGLFIVLYIFIAFALYIWRGIINKEVRYAMIGMGVAFAVSTFLPGVTNVLSRDGALDRGFHQVVINLCVVIGFFSFTMIYINTTRDRTTVMAKIVGISLAVFMLVLQAIGFSTLQEKETAYDQIQSRETALILARSDYRPENLRYITRFSNDAGFERVYSAADTNIDFDKLRIEFQNASVRERLLEQPIYSASALSEALAGSHEQFAGYAALIQSAHDQISESGDPDSVTTRSVLENVDQLERKILFSFNKLRMIPDNKFRSGALNFLNKSNDLAPMYAVVTEKIDARPDVEGAELKRIVLEYFKPLKPMGSRHYRRSSARDDSADPYTAFMAGGEDGALYEVGYSYLNYREFVHGTALRLFWILLAVLAVVLIGFRLFFRGALLQPLDSLVGGVSRVNDGDLDVELPVSVEDEIGFLAHSFNGMVRSIRAAKARLQEYADQLEEKVEARTAELKNTLSQVQALKQQQDGDYFLTSLLIKPLNSNRAVPKTVHTDFYLKQKKQFEFRNRNSEIGGDLCMVHQIQLKGSPYTVFLNADAMGKSMQGAGGALVLGSVFESMITRTQMSSEAKEVYPERWLKNAFIELHKIFESFEGSMLISLVLGLVDERNGFMYYINAEHPFSVVYRNGKAMFIEDELLFRKLGTTGMEGMIHIPTFQLEPGDQLIAGSDGRDDIVLGIHEETGERIINEDEEKFLTVVEEANGDLARIHELLLSEGEISDDLSLLSLRYTGDGAVSISGEEDAETQDFVARAREAARNHAHRDAVMFLRQARMRSPESVRVLKDLAVASYNLRDFNTAATLGREYVDLRPGDTEMIYMASLAFKKLRSFAGAADLAERVRLRDPRNVKNLLHLTEVHMFGGNLNRAEYILGHVFEVDPDNEKAQRLKERLEHKLSQAARRKDRFATESVN
ncbi:MAG: SpoIIE family protein phosphatase [bacterium]|nr:SpoIIE family protein phosphatase [bacterium]